MVWICAIQKNDFKPFKATFATASTTWPATVEEKCIKLRRKKRGEVSQWQIRCSKIPEEFFSLFLRWVFFRFRMFWSNLSPAMSRYSRFFFIAQWLAHFWLLFFKEQLDKRFDSGRPILRFHYFEAYFSFLDIQLFILRNLKCRSQMLRCYF